MSAVPVGERSARPRLAVVKGRRRLPRLAMAPWLLYTAMLALAFIGLVYAQSSLNTRAMELDTLTEQRVEAELEGDALRIEIARLSAPDRIVGRAEELGMELPEVPLRTLLVDDLPPPDAARTAAAP